MHARPRIGISRSPRRPDSYYRPYWRALEWAGARPSWLSEGQPESVDEVEGLLLPGGWDVDPSLYGEEPDARLGRVDPELDRFELGLVKLAWERGMPVLGICRGQQIVNVALGGSLHQHVPGHDVRDRPRHHLAHAVELEGGSEFAAAARAGTLGVNSLHHQAVKGLAPGLRASAWSPDGVVEAVESEKGALVAVQCHPEELIEHRRWARRLFERFVERARC